MCGRFSLHTSGATLAEQFRLPEVPELSPRYNIAPTQDVAVVRHHTEGRELCLLRWGLVPFWADDPAIGNRIINARAESVAEKPAFRAAFKRRRCLVLADGFYEWQARGRGKRKQPFYIGLQSGEPFAFAGLWEHWEHNGEVLETCTIITTEPNDLLHPIHNRMPVIVPPEQCDQWLAPTVQQAGPLQAMLQPYPAEAMRAYPVGQKVNNASNDSLQCIEPADA